MPQQLRQRPASILIVDDEPVQLRAIVTELNAVGFETLIARNGTDGLTKALHGNPDLILLDILMPGWDGYETCRQLKASPATRAIPVIFLSALCDTAEKLRGFEAGCIDYITKPFEHKEVLARVSAHLQQQSLFVHMAEQLSPVENGGELPDKGIEDKSGGRDQAGLHFVYRAIDILLAEMADPPTLKDLAHRVGTNLKLPRKHPRTHRQPIDFILEYGIFPEKV